MVSVVGPTGGLAVAGHTGGAVGGSPDFAAPAACGHVAVSVVSVGVGAGLCDGVGGWCLCRHRRRRRIFW